MQRKPTKNTRGPNAEEKQFQGWLKEHSRVTCGIEGPSIVDHSRGATFKHNKILCGHWFCLPYCVRHDAVKTQGSHRAHFNEFGVTQSELWLKLVTEAPIQPPEDVYNAIKDWGR